MKVIWECPLPDEYVYYVRKLDYEIAGARVVVERLLREGWPDNDLFRRYEMDYRKLLSERGTLMFQLMDEYLPEQYRAAEYAAHVNHHTGTLQVKCSKKANCACSGGEVKPLDRGA